MFIFVKLDLVAKVKRMLTQKAEVSELVDAGHDIHITIVKTAKSIIKARKRSLGSEDVESYVDIITSLVAFVAAMRDAYGVQPVSKSLAEGYMHQIEQGNWFNDANYSVILSIHDCLLSSLLKDETEQNYVAVFTSFMFEPISYDLKNVNVSEVGPS